LKHHHAYERLACERVPARDGGFPEVPARMEPARDLVGWLVVGGDGVAAEERVVHAMGVGQDVSAEASEYLADGVARVPPLVLEKHVVAIGEHDEEVAFVARLPLPDGERSGPDGDARRVDGEAKRFGLRLGGGGLDDAAERV
jgi:hypothetical protein